MKRFHVHIATDDLEQSIRFYSTVFGMPPTVQKDDYAKWMIEDPRVNFAISSRGARPGLDHLGFQVESGADLSELHARLEQADAGVTKEFGTGCCYAESDKYWITDPQGIAWETFHTLKDIPVFGKAKVGKLGDIPVASACCAPRR